MGKLLNPCALIPAEQVEKDFGAPITGDWRTSTMIPTTGYLWGFETYPTERILYVCRYEVGPAAEDEVAVGVEVFSAPQDAQEQMERYQAWLRAGGLEPKSETGVWGEGVYGFSVPPSQPLANAHLPAAYLASGATIVTVEIARGAGDYHDSDMAEAMDLAAQAFADIPDDRESEMPDQAYRLEDPWQPPGKPIEPCALIDRGQAQRTMDNPISSESSVAYWGQSYGGAGELRPGLDTSCTYSSSKQVSTLQGSPEMEGVSLKIVFVDDVDKEAYVTHSLDRNLRQVPGIGEIAFRDPASGEDLVVVQGNLIVTVVVGNLSDPDTQFQESLELAQGILSQLTEYELQSFGVN
jgi:hypothetical protein